jgi:type I restriction-modification system DNA methylase subunit
MLIKSKERAKELGEVFTPDNLVSEMMAQIDPQLWSVNKTFFEPSCGNGNFLVKILEMKIDKTNDILGSLKSIYGIDIMNDNIAEAQKRMLKVCVKKGLKLEDAEEAVNVLKNNIIVGSTLDIENVYD